MNVQKKDFELALRSSFPVINEDLCFSDEKCPFHYEFKNKEFKNIKECFKYINNQNDAEQNNESVYVKLDNLKDVKKVSVLFSEHKNFKFTDHWYYDFINKFTSETDFMNALKSIPEQIRMFCKDKNGVLLVHWLLYLKSEWCVNETMIRLVLNEKNAKVKGNWERTPLNFACDTNSLEVVKIVASIGGYVGTKNKDGDLPEDMTENEDIKRYLLELKNKC